MSITNPVIPGVLAPVDPTAKETPRSGTPDGPSAPPPNIDVIIPKPKIDVDKMTAAGVTVTPSVVQPSHIPPTQQQSSNPVAVPTAVAKPAVLPAKPQPVEQRMAAARDRLNQKLATAGFIGSSTTIRLDITSSAPGVEFIVYSSRLPETHPPTRHGTLGKYATIKEVEDAIERFVP